MTERTRITGDELRRMLLGAYQLFEARYQTINDLNVFPVPDGDTGTNMLQTLAAVARSLQSARGLSIGEVGTLASENALLGARGRVLGKSALEEALYAFDVQIEGNAVEVYISRLRQKIGPSLIETRRGLGYVLT